MMLGLETLLSKTTFDCINFRSVEKGIPLIRSANSGISVVTDENGKILKKIDLNKSGFIEQNLNLIKNETFFMKIKT